MTNLLNRAAARREAAAMTSREFIKEEELVSIADQVAERIESMHWLVLPIVAPGSEIDRGLVY